MQPTDQHTGRAARDRSSRTAPRRAATLALAALSLAAAAGVARGQNVRYWDVNGETAGAGNPASGAWATTAANWNTLPDGTGTTQNWVDGDDAVFSAGADATGPFTVTVDAAGVGVHNLTVEEGTPTITGGGTTGLTLTGTGNTFTIAAGSAVINSVVTGSAGLAKAGPGTLTLGGANTALTGGFGLNAGTLNLTNSAGAGPATNTITAANGTTINVGNSTTFVAAAAAVPSAATLTLTSSNATGGVNSTFTGSADSVINVAGTIQVNFGAGNVNQFTNFLGTVNVNAAATARFSSSQLNNGGVNTTFNVLGFVSARNGGTVRLGALTGNGEVFGSGNVDGTTTYVVGQKNVDSQFDGRIRNSTATRRAALTKDGTATLTLTGASDYTGATNVSNGRLLVNGTGSIAAGSPVTVARSGTLGGSGGTLAGPVTVNGTLAPGTSVGTLNLGSLTFGAAGVFAAELDGAAVTSDTVTTTDAVTIDPAATLTVADLRATAVPAGTQFILIRNGSPTAINGTFANVPEAFELPVGPNTYRVSYADNVDGGPVPNDLTLTAVAVPEPAALSLLACGGLGLLARRRRVRHAF